MKIQIIAILILGLFTFCACGEEPPPRRIQDSQPTGTEFPNEPDTNSDTGNSIPSPQAIPTGMVLVTAGEFLFGESTPLALPNFFIDQYEVTAQAYEECVNADACTYDGNPSDPHRTYQNSKANYPITYVDWADATAFCAWKHKRLPTEEEWEKAARGVDGRLYPWGNTVPSTRTANYSRSGDIHEDAMGYGASPVGYYNGENETDDSPSPYGVYDMAGNVWEWTSSLANPEQPWRIIRGGSFASTADYLRVNHRESTSGDYTDGNRGFRCAQDAPSEGAL